MKYVCLTGADETGYLGFFFVVGNFNKLNIKESFRIFSPVLKNKFQERINKGQHIPFKEFQVVFLGDDGSVDGDIYGTMELKKLILNFDNNSVRKEFVQKIYSEGILI